MHTVKFLIRSAVAFVVAVGFTAAAQRSDTTGASAISKLTTVLADLSQAVAQDQAPIAPLRVGTASPLSVDALPKLVQDSMRGGLLRINEHNEVQVYVLMSSLSDDDVNQLTAAG